MIEQEYRTWGQSLAPEENIKIISCDIFDTLLLRDGRAERERFLGSAELIKSLSRTSNRTLEEIYTSRVRAHTWLYSLWVNGHRKSEPKFEDICDLQLRLLLDPNLNRDILIEAELTIEKNALKENKLMSGWLSRIQNTGTLIIFLSDMYHTPEFIKTLLSDLRINLSLQEARIYTSSEIKKSKLKGDAFDFILNAYGIEPSNLMHIGDNYVSDVIIPSQRGIRAYHAPRSKAFLLKSQIMEKLFDASYYGRINDKFV